VVSWALVSFGSVAEARAALDGAADLHAPGLVVRKVDEIQAAHSAGAMGEVMLAVGGEVIIFQSTTPLYASLAILPTEPIRWARK
jgi:hypothetical protein